MNKMNKMNQDKVPRKYSDETVQRVLKTIEKYTLQYLQKEEIFKKLNGQVDMELFDIIWSAVKKQNEEYFHAYFIKLKIMNQMKYFNSLVKMQTDKLRKNRPTPTTATVQKKKPTKVQIPLQKPQVPVIPPVVVPPPVPLDLFSPPRPDCDIGNPMSSIGLGNNIFNIEFNYNHDENDCIGENHSEIEKKQKQRKINKTPKSITPSRRHVPLIPKSVSPMRVFSPTLGNNNNGMEQIAGNNIFNIEFNYNCEEDNDEMDDFFDFNDDLELEELKSIHFF